MPNTTQKITPHLWFDKEAKEAAEFYCSVFPESTITNTTTLHNTPSGDVDGVSFDLWGVSFRALSAGPFFRPNPSISFIVNFDPLLFGGASKTQEAKAALDKAWEKLSDGGKVLMPLDVYPFSERYGWVQDKYGFSWQLMLTDPEGEPRPHIVPSLMFVGENSDRAKEATDFYLSVFKQSHRGQITRYSADMEPDREGTVMFTDYMLEGVWMAAMDSAQEHDFNFNEAISLIVYCDNQEEIDDYWKKMSAVPESEQCGWLKDKYGVSWQIVPAVLDEMMTQGTREQVDRVTQAFLKMKKFDIEKLEEAYDGK